MIASEFTLALEQVDAYQFRVLFDKPEQFELRTDEPPPLGRNAGPNAARLLAAAIANCLAASFIFCAARKTGVKLDRVRAQVKVQIVRNENKRLRVGRVEVWIDPGIEAGQREALRPCIGLFEDFCTVTESVRKGVDVVVKVEGFDNE